MTFPVYWQPALITSDLGRMAHYSGLWGVDGVELRSLGRHRERVPDVNVAALRRRVIDADLHVACVDPGLFASDANERTLWMNDLQRIPDMLRFCRQVSAGAVILEGLRSPDSLPTVPYEEALRMGDSVPGLDFMVRDTDIEGQVADLVARVNSDKLKRAAETSILAPALRGDARHVGLIRCRSDFEELPDESSLRAIWSTFLAENVVAGFTGSIVFEFTSNVEPGKTGLRVATALIKAAAFASKQTRQQVLA